MSIIIDYANSLALLEGNDFQAEVCARLETYILGFQTIPSKPSGDAGLDAFSHGGEHGYCCYGPEHDSFNTAARRVKAIVQKFSSDLRRLFELEVKRKHLTHKESPEMATILPAGKKLKHIVLIVNWFESHRVLGPINTAFATYKGVSQCRYVDPAATLVIDGPTQLANRYAVDELSVYRISQRIFIKKVNQTAQTVLIQPKDFETKMQILREIRPDQVPAIDALSNQFQNDWRMALAFERELDETVPTLHQELENGRRQILVRISELMVSSSEPWTLLEEAQEIADSILAKEFGKLYGSLVPRVSSGEIARLVGECPIGWKKPESTLA